MKAGRDQAYKQAGQSAMGRSKANYEHDGAKARLLATKWVIMSGRCKEDPIRKQKSNNSMWLGKEAVKNWMQLEVEIELQWMKGEKRNENQIEDLQEWISQSPSLQAER